MCNKLYVCATVLSILGVFSPNASADMLLTLTSGVVTVTVSDNGVGDFDPAVGSVVFIGDVGHWHLTATGTVGTNPLIDLNAVTSLNTLPGVGANALVLKFSATDFANLNGAGILGQIGGTVGNGQALSYATYVNANNLLNATETLIGTTLSFGPGSFGGTAPGGLVDSDELVSLTQIVTISGTQKGLTSFNGAVDVTGVPEPAAIVTFGTLLLMTGPVLRRKLRRP